MKNGLFNIIRGIAFCFVLSIICLFGRVEAKADTSSISGSDIYNAVLSEYGSTCDYPRDVISILDDYANGCKNADNYALISVSYNNSNVKLISYYTWSDYVNEFIPELQTLCKNNGYTYLFGNLFLIDGVLNSYTGDNQYGSYNNSFSYKVKIDSNNKLTYEYSWWDFFYNSNRTYYTLDVISMNKSSSYDSTLGYLKNCVVKRGTTTSPEVWKSYSEIFTHNMDYFSWDSLTTTSREVKKVEYKLYFYNGNSVVHKENSFIESSRAGTYATSKTVFWNTFTDINWKDVLIDKNAHYEIWFRPCDGNLYGDWCYFDISLPSYLTRFLNSYNENDGDILSCFLYWIENGLDILGDGYYDLGQCTYAEKEGTYEPSESPDTNHSFSNVVNSYVVNYIDNSDNSVDDVTNIIESLPPSTNSYTEIYNNITVIQNGNENGSSLLDKFGDLLSFCKNFLTFIYNFINLILSPLSFLPGWLKSLLSMSIIAFIVICVIKTLRG